MALSPKVPDTGQTDWIRDLLDAAPAAVLATDITGKVLFANRRFRQLWGLALEGEVAGHVFEDPVFQSIASHLRRALAGQLVGGEEVALPAQKAVYEIVAFPVRDAAGAVGLAAAMLVDVATRKQAEGDRLTDLTRRLQTDKRDSLSALAGGVAHDFNNILTGVLGYAELSLLYLPAESSVRDFLHNAVAGILRAADLSNQMLAYSGQGRFVLQMTHLSRLVQEQTQACRAAASAPCELVWELSDELPIFQADQAQLRQLLLSLVVNASEAIGTASGRIVVRTGTVECDRAFLQQCQPDEEQSPGWYVFLEVEDTGCGMRPEVQARMFDPFFSTKFLGRGLGLAAALGIVRGHRGALRVWTEPGKGTRIQAVFPQSPQDKQGH